MIRATKHDLLWFDGRRRRTKHVGDVFRADPRVVYLRKRTHISFRSIKFQFTRAFSNGIALDMGEQSASNEGRAHEP